MLVSILGFASLFLRPAVAVFADQAWNTDYHYALLGQPQEDTTFFHQPSVNSKASLIYTLSDKGVVGAVNPRDGSLVWRHPLSSSSGVANSSFLRAEAGQDVVISGYGNSISAWSALDGRLSWQRGLPGSLTDLEILSLSDGSGISDVKDALALINGDKTVVQRLDGKSGDVKWSYSTDGTDAPYQISVSATDVFVIVLHKTLLGYIKIKVVTLDSVTGDKKDEYTLSSDSELANADTIISVGANSASPIVAWTDAAHSVLKVNIIGTKAISSFNIEKHGDEAVERVRLHAPYHGNSLAHFLVHYETAKSHWAEVFHVNLHKNVVEKAYQLPKLSGKGAFSTSVSDANVYFTRTTQEEIVVVSSTSHGILGKWPVRGFGTISQDATDNEPILATSELSIKGDAVSALRSVILLRSGDWVMLVNGKPAWQRPEALASTLAATFAVPSEVQSFAEALEIETHSNPVAAYMHRIRRHIADLQALPTLLSSIPATFARGFLGTTTDGAQIGDTFGFHQVIACAVSGGRVIAMDSGDTSKILWNKLISKVAADGEWAPAFTSSSNGLLVLQPAPGAPEIYLNASTGSLAAATPLPSDSGVSASSVSFKLLHNSLEATRSDDLKVNSLWRFAAPEGFSILNIVPRPVNDPVASIGKVLGDRRVLYKYLSPNLALVAAANEVGSSAAFYVLDTISGATLFSSLHHNVDLSAPISTIMSENWFAYSYTSDAFANSPKGHQLVVGEMFESLVPNDRGPLSSRANVSSLAEQVEPFVLTKTYQIPEAISKLSVSRTRQGITSRQLLAILTDSKSIVGIPYPVLDPRRPVGRDPTKDEQAEGLIRYAPTIEFDPKWFLNHQRELIGISEVVSSPALVESTSLIFAYGLDIFGTRITPSFSFDILGKDFNKFQMLATVAALAVLTFVVGPLVTRKQVNTRWQFT